ncbi:MAG: SsrA-binding protein SmpB [Candidatus Omnitrophica bacterium]|nr:SsrA-binding protein SmpB [Candidatus Omnitrophota bacterium]MBU4303074.1 SsrA-binding protein SmpB [Candidatus Omnitrophota bacterium]MBU4418365.1 SsrA-binding protein SmpB [Candidatus Omnitrophota bacterium]MBU4467742.1 SsrA-binding protein SmpB [Candidatus Omnitrophota bacterium]MCG2707499.1 SsrA-binding protein SmpB [Candidatus Omnitrophota bacterium]
MSNIIATNRKAYRDYEVLESLECGIELKGSEVKSLRAAKINLNDSFARFEEGEIFLYNAHISHYAQASYLNVDPDRHRKLLLHKQQLERINGKLTQKGLTLIPLKIYFNARGFAKIELGLCKGKKLYDKRETVKRRETDKLLRRVIKNRRG